MYFWSSSCSRFWRTEIVAVRFVKLRKIAVAQSGANSTTRADWAGRAEGRIPLSSYVCRETAATANHLLQLRLLRVCHPLRAASSPHFHLGHHPTKMNTRHLHTSLTKNSAATAPLVMENTGPTPLRHAYTKWKGKRVSEECETEGNSIRLSKFDFGRI